MLRPRAWWIAILAVAQLSCDTKKLLSPGGNSGDTPGVTAATIAVVSGASQSGSVSAALGSPVIVEVRGSDGNVFAGATVAFSASHGGTASPASGTTGSNGRVNATWTLGSTVATQTLTATTGSLQTQVTAIATAAAPAAATIVVSPAGVDLHSLGATAQLSALALDASNVALASQPAFTWASSDTTKVKVSASGVATAIGNGSATITAAASGKSGTRLVNVAQVVKTVATTDAVTLASFSDSVAITAQALDSLNQPVSGVVFTWTSADTAVAKVTTGGKVYGVNNGATRVRATAPSLAYDSTFVIVSVGAPAAPTLSGALISTTRIDLTWSNVLSETGYQLERCTGALCSTFAAIGSTATDVTTFADTTISANNLYTYRVRAAKGPLFSAYSGAVTKSTYVPTTPVATANTNSATQITVTWTQVDNEAGYEIQRCTGASCSNFVPVDSVAADVITFVDTGLGGASYSYRVRGFNGPIVGAFSNTATTSTLLPGTPTLTATIISASQVNLSWTDVGNEAGYRIERCAGASCTSFALLANVGQDVTTYSNTGLTSNSYTYRVRGENGTVVGSFSSPVTANVIVPASTGLTATSVSGSQITLTWSTVANATDYILERCSGASCSSFAVIFSTSAATTSYNNTGLPANTSFTYRMHANNGALAGPTTTATANTNVPGTPTLSVIATNTSTNSATWTDVANETSFEVESCSGAGCTPTLLTTTGAGVVTYAHSGRSTETVYRYRVRGKNGAIAGSYSNIVDVQTIGLAANGPCYLVACASSIAGAAAERSFFYLDVPAGSDSLIIELAPGTGDPDLYVQFGAMPTGPGAGVYTSANGADAADRVSIPAPAAGRWYINVIGYAAYSGYQIFNTPVTLVKNYAFEDQAANWSIGGAANIGYLYQQRSGLYNAVLGINSGGTPVNSANGTVYQTITVPAAAGAVTAEFYYRISTDEDKIVNTAYDYLYVQVRNTSGTLLSNRLTLSNSNYGSGYTRATVDLSPWRGQTVRLSFESTSDSSNPTVFRIDDVWMYWTGIR